MPLLRIQINTGIAPETAKALVAEASRLVAERLGKPERFVMVTCLPQAEMLFAGTAGPAAFLEVKSIGLSDRQTEPLARALCGLMERSLGIPKDRVYIGFADSDPAMWGWNGGTF